MALRVAILERFPCAVLPALGIKGIEAVEAHHYSGIAVEWLQVQALARHSDLDIHVVSFQKRLTSALRVLLPDRATLHLLPTPRLSGMSVGWLPRTWAMNRYLGEHVRPHLVHGIRTLIGYASHAVFSPYPNVITVEEFFDGVEPPARLRMTFAVGKRAEAITIAKAEHIIAISRHVERRIMRRSRAEIHLIPNMVSAQFYAIEKRQHSPVVLYVGRIAPEKGLLDVLRAAAILDAEGIRATWLVVGGPDGAGSEEYHRQCRQFAASQLNNQQVEFLGVLPNDQIAALYADAACGVYPSTAAYETFCLSVAESMASGTTPIVYDSGPLPEHVTDGESGFVVTPGDIASMANRIRRLLIDPDLARRMGHMARQRAGRYQMKRVAEQLLAVYQHVAEQAPALGARHR